MCLIVYRVVHMKTSVNLYFEKGIDAKTKIDTIKALGYDEFFTTVYDQCETMTFIEQIRYAKEIGLPCTMVHCSYYEPRLNSFWLDGAEGDDITEDYIRQINLCGALTKNFVVHLNCSSDCPVSEIGIARLRKILKVCEKYHLNLCVENLCSVNEIPYIFAKLEHPLLKICFDSGHHHWLMPNFNICREYAKYITTLHLHENNGTADDHKKLTIGSSVFNYLKENLSYLDSEIVLTSELKNAGKNWVEYLRQNLVSLKELGNLLSCAK